MGDLTKKYCVDAIEVLNGGAEPKLNRLAEELAKEMDLPSVAGSDAHNVEELWSVYTAIEAPLNLQEVLDTV